MGKRFFDDANKLVAKVRFDGTKWLLVTSGYEEECSSYGAAIKAAKWIVRQENKRVDAIKAAKDRAIDNEILNRIEGAEVEQWLDAEDLWDLDAFESGC